MIVWRGARSATVLLAALVIGLGLSACAGAAPPAPVTSMPSVPAPGNTATASSPADGSEPVASAPADEAATGAPAASPSGPAPESAPPSGAGQSPEASQSPTAYAGPGAMCTGSDDNRRFWASAAATMQFDVYCPVLPAGWIVGNGQWQGANGGHIDIVYSGPGGARLELHEGAFCTSGLSACSAHDQVVGPASFGDRTGSLDSLGPDAGWAIYVDPGKAPSWSIIGTRLSQATFTLLAAALVKVARS